MWLSSYNWKCTCVYNYRTVAIDVQMDSTTLNQTKDADNNNSIEDSTKSPQNQYDFYYFHNS